jgi:hypothetical protein
MVALCRSARRLGAPAGTDTKRPQNMGQESGRRCPSIHSAEFRLMVNEVLQQHGRANGRSKRDPKLAWLPCSSGVPSYNTLERNFIPSNPCFLGIQRLPKVHLHASHNGNCAAITCEITGKTGCHFATNGIHIFFWQHFGTSVLFSCLR